MKLPDMGMWETGQMDTSTRCLDLLCFGKCDLNSADIKLNVDSAGRIPNFFTKNAEGKIVVSSPQPMMTITTPKDHNTWVQIELKTINGKGVSELSEFEKHVCLGIKKRSKNDYFCVLGANNLSEYVDLFDWDALELVPLLSNTEGVIAPGEEIDPTNFGLTSADSFDFGSVYRVSVVSKEKWLNRSVTELKGINSAQWRNYGHLGVGPVFDQNGQLLSDQLVSLNDTGQFAYSSDGIHWTSYSSVAKTSDTSKNNWWTGPVCGNGIWCVINTSSASNGIRYSTDGGNNWSDSVMNICAYGLAFGNGQFITIAADGTVYMSPNAKVWGPIGYIPQKQEQIKAPRIFVYGSNKWICCSWDGCIFSSKTGEGEWNLISKELYGKLSTGYCWDGGCHANGYFYISHPDKGTVMRSPDGISWECIDQFSSGILHLFSITYYGNRLYIFDNTGTRYFTYLPN